MEIKKIPIIIAVVLFVIGIILFVFQKDVGLLGNFVLMALVIGIIPYIMLSYLEYQRMKSIEDQLPVFLLDLAETQKGGMSIPDALKLLAKTDYGKLGGEIKKIADQLSWGIPLQEAMNRFSFRMKGSDIIRRAIRIINEAYSSGGDVARTVETTAGDITVIKESEKERKSMMFQHTIVMYAIYFIFIGVIIGISKTLVPMLQMGAGTAGIMGGMFAFQDPCKACVGNPNIYCISCSIFYVICEMFALGAGASCYYRALFISLAIVQGIFSGLVIGQIGENSVIAGIKHSLILTGSGFVIIMLLLYLNIM